MRGRIARCLRLALTFVITLYLQQRGFLGWLCNRERILSGCPIAEFPAPSPRFPRVPGPTRSSPSPSFPPLKLTLTSASAPLHRYRESELGIMSARVLSLFAMMGSARAVVSTIGQVRQVSFEAYDQMGEALDADSRDVTVTNDGDCCMPRRARTAPRTNRPSIDAFLPGLDSCLHL